jgi:16S rRNA (guanine966-N2)-methyltransferase
VSREAASLLSTVTETRIIAGEFKGRRLITPRGRLTRPTADQVRTALMDALTPWLPAARFLDLFSGAGGVGLEALSRGAAHAVFVERDARAIRALTANIGAVGVGARTRVLRQDVVGAIHRLNREGARYELIFLDPPYADAGAVPNVLGALSRASLLEAGGLVIVQHPSKDPPDPGEGLTVTRTRKFGETTLTFFRREG